MKGGVVGISRRLQLKIDAADEGCTDGVGGEKEQGKSDSANIAGSISLLALKS